MLFEGTLSRATMRILGNISVFLVLAGLVLLLVMAALSPDFLKNDVKLTAEANTGTPIVQASPSPTTSQPKISGENERLAAWALKTHRQWDQFQSQTTPYKSGFAMLFPDQDPGAIGEWVRILQWSAPADGQLTIQMESSRWKSHEMQNFADYVAEYMYTEFGEVYSATVMSENGKTLAVARGEEFSQSSRTE